jgi:hypothetical protein
VPLPQRFLRDFCGNVLRERQADAAGRIIDSAPYDCETADFLHLRRVFKPNRTIGLSHTAVIPGFFA